MSVTFWVPDAPRERKIVPCTTASCFPDDRCGYCIDGKEEQITSPAPDLNLCEGNAAIVLAILGERIGEDKFGDWAPAIIPRVRRRIVRALNVPLAQYTRSGGTYEVAGQARLIEQGIDVEGIHDRLRRLDAVLVYAQAHGQKVSWG